MTLWGIARRNLLRRPLRSFLTMVGIAVAVAGFLSLIGLSHGLETAWENNFRERGTQVLAIRKGAVEILSTSLDESLGAAIERVSGIRAAAGELVDMLPLASDRVSIVNGWPGGTFLWKTLHLEAGRLPETGEQDVVVLGRAVAQMLGLSSGQSLTALGQSIQVVGICRQADPMGNHSVIFPLDTLQTMLNKKGQVTAFNIVLSHPEDHAAVTSTLEALSRSFPKLSFMETTKLAETNHILRLLRAISWGMSAIGVVLAILVVMNTLFMSVAERTREISILGALGWTWQRIGSLIFLEGLLLTALGGAMGTFFGMVTLLILAQATPLAGYIEPSADGGLLAIVFLCVLILGIMGSLLPALRAIRLNVAEGLRHE